MQYTVDPLLEARIGGVLRGLGVELAHVIVLDPASGEVHAYVSTRPRVFPADRTYPTASLMKVLTAAAVLRDHREAWNRPCRYAGSPYALRIDHLRTPPLGGRVVSAGAALADSNNQCFARLALTVGTPALLSELRRVGLLDAPAPGHPRGEVAEIDDALALAELGSGLAGSSVSPLAAARLAAALDQGLGITPRWIARVRDAWGRERPLPEPPEPERVWPLALAGELRTRLTDVTESGTAADAFRLASEPPLGTWSVAGKTGSLSGPDPEGFYRWFAGVAPAEAPQVAIAVLVVNAPVSAAHVAAGVLRTIFCNTAECSADAGRALRARAQQRERAAAERRERRARERTQALRQVRELDAPPRPLEPPPLVFPRRLRRAPAQGEVVLVLDLAPDGAVTRVEIASSTLPEFGPIVAEQVARWRFSPPTVGGRPVAARARLPVPIRVRSP